jgi:hypothetical protein
MRGGTLRRQAASYATGAAQGLLERERLSPGLSA